MFGLYTYGWSQGVFRKDFCVLVGTPVLHLVLVTEFFLTA